MIFTLEKKDLVLAVIGYVKLAYDHEITEEQIRLDDEVLIEISI